MKTYYIYMNWWYIGELDKKVAEAKAAGKSVNSVFDEKPTATKVFQYDGPVDEAQKYGLDLLVKENDIDLSRIDERFSLVHCFEMVYPTLGDVIRAEPIYVDDGVYRIDSFLPTELQVVRVPDQERVKVRIYADMHVDYDRGACLGACFFDDEPVFVFQLAGRGGRDHEKLWMVSRERYDAMNRFLLSLIEDRRDPDADLAKVRPEISSFYSCDIGAYPRVRMARLP